MDRWDVFQTMIYAGAISLWLGFIAFCIGSFFGIIWLTVKFFASL